MRFLETTFVVEEPRLKAEGGRVRLEGSHLYIHESRRDEHSWKWRSMQGAHPL